SERSRRSHQPVLLGRREGHLYGIQLRAQGATAILLAQHVLAAVGGHCFQSAGAACGRQYRAVRSPLRHDLHGQELSQSTSAIYSAQWAYPEAWPPQQII